MAIFGDQAILEIEEQAADLLKDNINDIQQIVRRRIFLEGKNAADEQMARARIRPGPLYRYQSGQLLRSQNTRIDRNTIEMTFSREQHILEYLEEKYGEIFEFSERDVDNINELLTEQIANDESILDKFVNRIKKIFKS